METEQDTPSTTLSQVRDIRQPGHFWADNEIADIHLKTIGEHGFAVYMLLSRFVNSGTAQCDPSIPTIASRLGISETTVKAALKKLAAAKLIFIEHRHVPGKPKYSRTNVYTLLPVEKIGREAGTVTAGVGQQATQGGSAGDPGVGQQATPNKNQLNKTHLTNNTLSQTAYAAATGAFDSIDSDIDNAPPSKELTAFKEKHAVDRLSGVADSSSQAVSDTAVEGTKTLPEKLTTPPDHTSRSNESADPSEMSDTAIQDRTHFTSPPPPPLQIPEGYEAAYSSDGVVHLYKAKIKHPTTCAKCHKHFDTWSQIPGGKHYEPCSLWVIPAPPDAVMERLSMLCYGTLDQLKVNGTWGYLRQVYNDLYPAVGGITAGQVEVFRERWYKNFWKGRDKRERPTPKDIKDNWLSLMTADAPAQAAVDKTSIAWLMGPEAKAEARRMAELRDTGEDET